MPEVPLLEPVDFRLVVRLLTVVQVLPEEYFPALAQARCSVDLPEVDCLSAALADPDCWFHYWQAAQPGSEE